MYGVYVIGYINNTANLCFMVNVYSMSLQEQKYYCRLYTNVTFNLVTNNVDIVGRVTQSV
jgi:hypothetical protein